MKLKDIDKQNKVAEIVGSTGNIYFIYKDSLNKYSCDCPARKTHCKHVKEYLFKMHLEVALTDLEYRGFFTQQSEGAFDNVVNCICKLRKEWL